MTQQRKMMLEELQRRNYSQLTAEGCRCRPPHLRSLPKGGGAPSNSAVPGCVGVGDTTFLTADLVGPGGFVVGMDRSADAVATARQRAETAGRPNVLFVRSELGLPIADQKPFDAVVGRYVLIHQPDIVAALRSVRSLVT